MCRDQHSVQLYVRNEPRPPHQDTGTQRYRFEVKEWDGWCSCLFCSGYQAAATRILLWSSSYTKERAERDMNWQQTNGWRQAKLLLGSCNLKRLKQTINLPRNKFKFLASIYIGHCRFKIQLYNIGLVSTAMCRYCDMEPETQEQLLLDRVAICRCKNKALGSLCPRRDASTL